MSQPRPKPNLSPKAVPGLEAKCSFVVRNQSHWCMLAVVALKAQHMAPSGQGHGSAWNPRLEGLPATAKPSGLPPATSQV